LTIFVGLALGAAFAVLALALGEEKSVKSMRTGSG
jgi:hypothetical protein